MLSMDQFRPLHPPRPQIFIDLGNIHGWDDLTKQQHITIQILHVPAERPKVDQGSYEELPEERPEHDAYNSACKSCSKILWKREEILLSSAMHLFVSTFHRVCRILLDFFVLFVRSGTGWRHRRSELVCLGDNEQGSQLCAFMGIGQSDQELQQLDIHGKVRVGMIVDMKLLN